MSDDEIKESTSPPQICSLRIGFPVKTDEDAIAYKKKLSAIVADIPNVRIEFSLSQMPPGMPMKG